MLTINYYVPKQDARNQEYNEEWNGLNPSPHSAYI